MRTAASQVARGTTWSGGTVASVTAGKSERQGTMFALRMLKTIVAAFPPTAIVASVAVTS